MVGRALWIRICPSILPSFRPSRPSFLPTVFLELTHSIIIQVRVEEFDLNQEEEVTSLKKAADNRMLKIVNKNNKNSYRIVQETHLDEDCVIDSQIGETLESTGLVKDLPIRLEKTSHDDLTNLANKFRLFKAEMQQQITSLRNIS